MSETFIKEHAVILLAEDNDDDAFFIQRAFEKARLSNPIIRVTDGEQVIQYLEGEEKYSDRNAFPCPYFLLLDLMMPKVDGFGVLEWIRKHPLHNKTLVVVLTGQNVDSPDKNPLVARAYELGANSFLRKTPNFDDMVRLVQTIGGYWLMVNVPPPKS
jgi:CheY-like chemotaxis protein